MITATDGQKYNVVWHFRCNARTREYTFTVKYYSNLPPAQHEALHERFKNEALQWLLENGHAPHSDKIKIKFMGRLEAAETTPGDVNTVPQPIPQPEPLPEPRTNEQIN